MAAIWKPQSVKPSTTARSRERTAWLRPLRATFVEAIRAYYAQEPDGEQVTLACLRAVGPVALREAGGAIGRGEQEVKMDAGLYVPMVLAALAGAENVATYRDEITGKNSTRPRSSRWFDLDWVSSYTPHRVNDLGLQRILGGHSL